MRDKTKRASVVSGNPFSTGHGRSKSFNTAAPEPPREIIQPAPPPPPAFKSKKPDHLGERMLRGDFMMDWSICRSTASCTSIRLSYTSSEIQGYGMVSSFEGWNCIDWFVLLTLSGVIFLLIEVCSAVKRLWLYWTELVAKAAMVWKILLKMSR